jgi:signal transduction histidine kinase
LNCVLTAGGYDEMAALESKNAGKALALIVMLLMVPMLLIGYFYYSSASVEITTLEHELAGSQLLQAVYPPLMSADKKITSDQLKQIHKMEEMFPSTNGGSFEDRWANNMQTTVGMTPTKLDAMSQNSVAAYIGDVASDSGLALDSDGPSYFMIDAAVLTLPRLVKDLQDLSEQMQSLASDPSDYKNKITHLAQLQGRVKAIRERFSDSLSRSVSLGGKTDNITRIKAVDALLGSEIESLSGLTFNAAGAISSDNYIRFLRAQNTILNIKEHARAIAFATFVELDRKLNARLTAAKNKLDALTLLGFSTAALGLGLAHQMFRKTLIKLDQVDTARLVAVTAHEDAEQINTEIASLNKNLAEKVRELQEAQNEIVKKGRMEQLGQLTATIAHELRNPLGSVRTSAYLINRKAGGKGLGIDEQISRIEKGVVRCDNIITQLLDFSRTKQITAMPANLDSWLAGIVTEEANKLPASVQIDCILGLDDTSVPFDPARMQRAVINLLNNAVEAMTNKDINAADSVNGYPHIWISTFRSGQEAAIRVKDNGPGIDAELIHKIREPLYTTKSFGTGLGIPAIEQIAVQHHGRLEINSRKGDGAEFTIFIPVAQVETDEPNKDANMAAVA